MARDLQGANLVPAPQIIESTRPDNISPAIASIYSQLEVMVAALNGKLSFGNGVHRSNAGNMDGQIHEITFPAAPNTEFAIRHNLDRVPVGYIVFRKAVACDVYDSSSGSWSNTTIYLKCTVADAVVALILF